MQSARERMLEKWIVEKVSEQNDKIEILFRCIIQPYYLTLPDDRYEIRTDMGWKKMMIRVGKPKKTRRVIDIAGQRQLVDLNTISFCDIEYVVEGESKIVNKDTQIGWKIFLMGEEFTKTDKIIYLLNYAWTGLWTIVFIVGTIYNLSNDVSNTSWMNFWKNYLYVHIVFSIFIIIWFTLGGLNDLKVMLTKLKTDYRDHQDDGWVTKEKN